MFLRFLRFVACVRTSFFFVAEYYSVVFTCMLYTHHVLLIHLSVDGHGIVSTCWLLWIRLLWILAYEYVFEFRSFGCVPGMELLGHMVVLCLTFWGTIKLYISFYTLCFVFFLYLTLCYDRDPISFNIHLSPYLLMAG